MLYDYSSHFFRFWCCIFHWRFWVIFHGSFNLSLGDPPQFPVSQTSGWLPRFHSHIPWFSTGNIGILARYCQNNMHWLPLCHVYCTFVLICFFICFNHQLCPQRRLLWILTLQQKFCPVHSPNPLARRRVHQACCIYRCTIKKITTQN